MQRIANLVKEDARPVEMLLYNNKLIIIWNKEVYSEYNPYAHHWGWGWWLSECETIVEVYDTNGNFLSPVSSYSQDGRYISSRMINNTIYLITTYNPRIFAEFTVDDFDAYIPAYRINDDEYFVLPTSIVLPEKLEHIEYTVISGLDVNQNELLVSVQASLGGSHTIYSSFNNVYVTRTVYEYPEYDGDSQDDIWGRGWWGWGNYQTFTIIEKFAINAGQVNHRASGKVEGTARNQFSFDEHNGVLRVVTEIWGDAPKQGGLSGSYQVLPIPETAGWWDERADWARQGWWHEDEAERYEKYEGWGLQGGTLYTLDGNLNILAQVHRIGFGENVQSVRFMGNIGYIVTFWQTDPLFSFDLSNPRNPVMLDELKIPGFSSYMHKWADGLLLGMGVETNDNGIRTGLKLTMFDVSDLEELIEKHVHVFAENNNNSFNDNSSFWSWSYSPIEHEHKAILISPEKNIIAFPYTQEYSFSSWSPNNYRWSWGAYYAYAIFSYDPETGFTLIGEIKDEFNYNSSDNYNYDYYYDYWAGQFQRGLYIGDYIYAAAGNKIISVVVENNAIEVIQTLQLTK